MKFHVHIYHVMRSKFAVEADNQVAAIAEAEKKFSYNQQSASMENESAEEVTGYLVDEVADDDHVNSKWYLPDGVTPDGLKHYYVRYDDDEGIDYDLLVHAYTPADAFDVWQEYYGEACEDVDISQVLIDEKVMPTGRGAMLWP